MSSSGAGESTLRSPPAGLSWARASPERSLILAARRGEPDAIERLVTTHWLGAWRIAIGIVQDAAAAEDIAQESLLAAADALPRFNPRRPFKPWLYRIVSNRAIDWLRSSERRQAAETLAAGTEGRAEVAVEVEAEISDRMRTAFLSLSAPERAAVVLRHVGGLGSREIAIALDTTRTNARTILSRGMVKLRARLEQARREDP